MEDVIDHEWLEKMVTRREWLCTHVPHCPACTDEQVQLIDHHEPALWCCRICKHRFTYEP